MSDTTVRSILIGIVLGGGVIFMVEASLWYWRTAVPWISERIQARLLREERRILAEHGIDPDEYKKNEGL